MTDNPTAPPPRTSAARTGDAPLDDSGDPELEQALAGEELEGEGDDESDEDDDGTNPLAGPVPEPPPPHDEKEPEPVPPTLWESDADHLDPTAPVPRDHAPDIDPEKLDPDALKVVNRLLQYGHQAYLVGGCVRDLLLGRTPKDFDIATSADAERGEGAVPQLPHHRPALPAGARLLRAARSSRAPPSAPTRARSSPTDEAPREAEPSDGRPASSAATTSSAPPRRTRGAATSPSTACSTTSRAAR